MCRSFSPFFLVDGLGYGFGVLAAFLDPTATRFALMAARMSYISAKIALVFVVVTHAAPSGCNSRISAESGAGYRRKLRSASQLSDRPTSSS